MTQESTQKPHELPGLAYRIEEVTLLSNSNRPSVVVRKTKLLAAQKFNWTSTNFQSYKTLEDACMGAEAEEAQMIRSQ